MEWIKQVDAKPKELNEDGKRNYVWLASRKSPIVFMGYYNESMKCFFDFGGNGCAVSHWTPSIKPELPKNYDTTAN